MDGGLQAAIREAALKRRQAADEKVSERVPWDINVQGLAKRFHQEYSYVLMSAWGKTVNGAGPKEGPALAAQPELDAAADVIRLHQTADDIGTTVYTTAIQVSRLLERVASEEKGAASIIPLTSTARVLELGSGTGLVGLVASRLGVAEVTLTDLDGPVLDNCRRNAEANPGGCGVAVRPLPWGSADPSPEESGSERWDVVLAVEVVYQKDMVAPLVATLRRLLAGNPAAALLWAHDERGRPGVPLFRELTRPFIDFVEIPPEQFPKGYRCAHVKAFVGKWKQPALDGAGS
ncbi:hypothetical protein DIPPA_22157 [Diplonema papillatum]|nr:hypothetical protein DIPPA_22157 [Diplonema papillatum]